MRVVAIAGNAPYLGGAATWEPLRRELSEFEIVRVDALEYGDRSDLVAALRNVLVDAVRGATAVVAHGTPARLAIEAVAAVDPRIAVLLLSPQIVVRESWRLRAVSGALTGGAGAAILGSVAKKKYEKLLADESYVRKQLRMLVRDDAITGALVAEARARIASVQGRAVAYRAAELVGLSLEPVDAGAFRSLSRCAAIVGPGPLERKGHGDVPVTVVEGVRLAPMLDAPRAVAAALRGLVRAA